MDYIAKHTKLVVSECLSHYFFLVFWVLIHPESGRCYNAECIPEEMKKPRSCGPMFFTRLRLLRRRHQAGSQLGWGVRLEGDFFLFQSGFHVTFE